jgi:hypothetical protein
MSVFQGGNRVDTGLAMQKRELARYIQTKRRVSLPMRKGLREAHDYRHRCEQ